MHLHGSWSFHKACSGDIRCINKSAQLDQIFDRRSAACRCGAYSQHNISGIWKAACRSTRLHAGGDNSDVPMDTMSAEKALDVLGVGATASFDECLQAKNKLLSKSSGDKDKSMEIEMAYDILLMRSMKQRISGELQPARDVRYADVPKYRPASFREKQWHEKVFEKLPGRVQVRPPRANQAAVTQGLIFGALAVSTLLQGLYLPSAVGVNDVPGLQLGLCVGASIYFLRDGKQLSVARAGALTASGLVLGTILGSALQSWLRVDIVPIGDFRSPAVLVSEFSIFGMWLSTYFLA